MPKAKQPLPPQSPHPLKNGEAQVIKKVVERFFGQDAIIRNFGADPDRLQLHVETSRNDVFANDECVGVLNCKIVRDQIDLTVTKRGDRVRGFREIGLSTWGYHLTANVRFWRLTAVSINR
ncbi:MAG: hypothetical protein AAFO78_10215 [Pseudomonadota bacterium]